MLTVRASRLSYHNEGIEMARLYLDVDGVINANFNANAWSQDGRRVGQALVTFDDEGKLLPPHEQRKYQIMWSADMIARLSRLIEHGLEVIWLTTWRSDADWSIAPLVGLPGGLRVLHPLDGLTTFPSIHWKYDAIQKDTEGYHENIFWADDEIQYLVGYKGLDYRPRQLGGIMPLWIDPNLGITPSHLDAIEAALVTEGK